VRARGVPALLDVAEGEPLLGLVGVAGGLGARRLPGRERERCARGSSGSGAGAALLRGKREEVGVEVPEAGRGRGARRIGTGGLRRGRYRADARDCEGAWVSGAPESGRRDSTHYDHDDEKK